MRKIDKPLGWVDPQEKVQEQPEKISNKEEPDKKKRKTKEVESEPVVEQAAEVVAEAATERSDS